MEAARSNADEFDLPAALSLLATAIPFAPPDFDFSQIPQAPGVFVLETGGEPFLGKSANLRRRLQRLLGLREEAGQKPSKRLNLRDTAATIHYGLTGSAFETWLLLYRTARALFPRRYRELLRLRLPPVLKVNLANAYPRCYVTRRLGRGRALYYGPFPSRAAAEKFAPQFLDLFLVRRCTEEIRPDPAHPGCIYGEMNMCLRPCQNACTAGEYAAEVERLSSFLSTGGASLLKGVEAGRDRASERLDFEEAAQWHKRAEKIHEALKHRPDLAVDLERLHGLVIQRAAAPGLAAGEDGRAGMGVPTLQLFPVWRGFLLPPITFTFEVVEGRPVSLDARLREAIASIRLAPAGSSRVRAEHLALLARWYYRGTRQGEFIPFESYDRIPFRKIVGAIGRIARG